MIVEALAALSRVLAGDEACENTHTHTRRFVSLRCVRGLALDTSGVCAGDTLIH